MGLAQDLLQQADHLATYEGVNPTQAGLRRSVSTAYYALFHLLIETRRATMAGFIGGAYRLRTRIPARIDEEHFETISKAGLAGLAR